MVDKFGSLLELDVDAEDGVAFSTFTILALNLDENGYSQRAKKK